MLIYYKELMILTKSDDINRLMPNGLGLQSCNMLILTNLLIQDLNEYELTKYVDINILRISKGNNPFSIVPIASISTSSR